LILYRWLPIPARPGRLLEAMELPWWRGTSGHSPAKHLGAKPLGKKFKAADTAQNHCGVVLICGWPVVFLATVCGCSALRDNLRKPPEALSEFTAPLAVPDRKCHCQRVFFAGRRCAALMFAARCG
jgi:hypothetical protein